MQKYANPKPRAVAVAAADQKRAKGWAYSFGHGIIIKRQLM